MNILDQGITKYVFKRQSSSQTEIKNNSDKVIGKVIHSQNLKMLYGIDGELVLQIEREKSGTIHKHLNWDIRGKDSNSLGTVSQNPLNQETTVNHLQFKGAENDVILDTFLPQIDLKEKILDRKEKELANISVRKSSGPERHIWTLQISDTSFDRKIILGIFLCVFEEEPKEYHEPSISYSADGGWDLQHPMEFGKNS